MVKPCAEKLYAGQRIVLQVFSRAGYDISGRFTEPSVIVSQRGNACPGESVCDDRERLVPEQLLIPVLKSAACNHYYYGSGFVAAGRKRERAFKHSSTVHERHIFSCIWERACRCLGTVELGRTLCKGHRERHSVLGICADDGLPEPYAFECSIDGWYPERQFARCAPGYLDRNSLCALIRYVQSRSIAFNVEHKVHRHPRCLQFSGPDAGLCICGNGEQCGNERSQPHKRFTS